MKKKSHSHVNLKWNMRLNPPTHTRVCTHTHSRTCVSNIQCFPTVINLWVNETSSSNRNAQCCAAVPRPLPPVWFRLTPRFLSCFLSATDLHFYMWNWQVFTFFFIQGVTCADRRTRTVHGRSINCWLFLWPRLCYEINKAYLRPHICTLPHPFFWNQSSLWHYIRALFSIYLFLFPIRKWEISMDGSL